MVAIVAHLIHVAATFGLIIADPGLDLVRGLVGPVAIVPVHVAVAVALAGTSHAITVVIFVCHSVFLLKTRVPRGISNAGETAASEGAFRQINVIGKAWITRCL
nr:MULTISPECIES: hypothetical protein [Paracoccus]